MLRSATTSFYHADGLGSITSLSNAAGVIAQTYTFDSFGNQTASSGSLTNWFQHTGREFDTETSLYYYRARYYDPAAGRFLSEDPLRFGMGPMVRSHHSNTGRILSRLMTHEALRGRSTDFYTYISNSPTKSRDPRGLWQATIGGGDGIGLLVTFGHNNGHWNIGVDIGGGIGLFGSLDPDEVDCSCGVNAHGEGDLGIIGLEGLGGSLNIDQNGDESATLTLSDPNSPNRQWTWDPSGPEPPHPAVGIGAGLFSGVGYTWCF